jgi:two-component system sensor histidine kinase BaeS
LYATVVAQLLTLGGLVLMLIFAGALPAGAGSEGGSLLARATVFGVLVLILGALAGLVAASIGVRLARGYAQRLQRLAEIAEAAASGDLTARVAALEPDEIGQIGVQLNLLAERLDAAQRSRRSFVSTISHELRTPLAIIRGHVETQLRASEDPCREVLEVIERETHVLGALVEDLFTLAGVEEAGLAVSTQPVMVQTIAAAAVAGIRPLATRAGQIVVHSAVPAELPAAQADPARLAQIFNNLLYNALRATPEGGVIVIEGALVAGGAAIELAVSDTGIGIATAALPHIFERFYRGESDPEGRGLGLAIVKELVEAHGGAVWATSVPGEGTTIRFTLPRAG